MRESDSFKESFDGFLVEQFSAGGLCNEKERKKLEEGYAAYLEITDKFSRKSVSYQLSKKDALHSWLKYKEGFSADLVNILLDEMGVQKGDWIMDPFLGSGTTGLVCRMRGINSIGYDIMPLSSVVVKAKKAVYCYNIQEITNLLQDVERLNTPEGYEGKTEYINITQDAYPEQTESFLQYIREWNENSSYSDDGKNLLTLCIINSLERCSYTSKSGQYLSWDCRSGKVIETNRKRAEKGQKLLPQKYVRAEIGNIKETIAGELAHVLDDIKTIQENSLEVDEAQIRFVENSVLYEIPKLKDGILNGIIRMVEGYFTELGFVFAELYRLCKKGAMAAFVNDNVRYGGEVIPVDFLSCALAEDFGFKVKKIYTLKQQKGNSSQQMAKFGKVALRKGITIWMKE